MSAEIIEQERTALAPAAQPGGALTLTSEAAAMIAMIERVALNPDADIAKLRELYALRKEIVADEAKRAFDDALAAMQPDLPIIEKKGRIEGELKRGGKLSQAFARWEDIAPAIMPVLARHRFSLRFEQAQVVDVAGQAKTRVTAILAHGGHRESAHFDLPLDTSGSKNNTQAYGSTGSYGKRYAATFVLNLVTKGEDDDGKSAETAFITTEQVDQLIAMCNEIGGNLGAFCRRLGVDGLPELPARRYDDAVALLEEKRRSTKA